MLRKMCEIRCSQDESGGDDDSGERIGDGPRMEKLDSNFLSF